MQKPLAHATASAPAPSAASSANPKRIAAFFYGSFIRRDVMALCGFHPDTIEVARLNGYDIAFDPHANIFRSDEHAVCGVLTYPTHAELHSLYARDGVGVFLPEAVIIETKEKRLLPALCFLPPARGNQPADVDYVGRIIEAGRMHSFPGWYLDRLETLRAAGPR